MNLIDLYYHLTAYVPRRLPATPEQYEHFKTVLVHRFGLPDEPPTWVTVSGQITSTQGDRLRKPWGSIANNVKRLRINNLAMGHKHAAMEQLNLQLQAAVEAESKRIQAEDANAQKAQEEQSAADAVETPTQSSAPEIKDGLC